MSTIAAGPDTSPDPEALEREADRLVRELGIPPCPQILARFRAEMLRDDPDLRTLAALITHDVALSAAMLKTVNSAFYGLGTKVTGVPQALAVLGLRASATLVSGLLLRQAFPAAASIRMERFWELSGALASTAATVAAQVRNIDRDEAHTFALFRECGMALMIARFREYDGVHRFTAGQRVTAEEELRFHYNHARVGYALARGWLLPEHLCRAILHHHDFGLVLAGHKSIDPRSRRLVAFGLLTQQVATLRAERKLCPEWPEMESYVLESLDVAPDEIVALAGEPEAEPA